MQGGKTRVAYKATAQRSTSGNLKLARYIDLVYSICSSSNIYIRVMLRSWVSPGIAYLSRVLLSVTVPAASSVLIAVRLASSKGFRISPWILSAVALGAAPLGFVAYVLVDERSQRQKASRLGARLIPRVEGKWPGNLDKMIYMVTRSDHEYLGTFHAIRPRSSHDILLSRSTYTGRDQRIWTDY